MGKLNLKDLEEMDKRLQQIFNTYPPGSDQEKAAVNTVYGSIENMVEYLQWYNTKRERTIYFPKPIIPSRDEFTSTINNVNFNKNKGNFMGLSKILDLPATPYIPIGNYGGFRFSLSPCTDTLRSDSSNSYQLLESDQLLPQSFLNVHIETEVVDDHELSDIDPDTKDFSPTQPGHLLLPSPSILTRPSFHQEFVVYQLGKLDFYPSLSCDLEELGRDRVDWRHTAFVVVMKLYQDGTKDGIYIICNSDRICDLCDERHHTGELRFGDYVPTKYDCMKSSSDDKDGAKASDDEVEDQTEKIYCAHIAANFEDLEHGKDFRIRPVKGKITALSRVIRTSDGSFAGCGIRMKPDLLGLNVNEF